MLPKPTQDDVAELLKRFADAGWTQGTALVGDKGSIVFSARGLQRMDSLATSFLELGKLTEGQLSALFGLMAKFHHRGNH